MWDMIVLIPDHCLSIHFEYICFIKSILILCADDSSNCAGMFMLHLVRGSSKKSCKRHHDYFLE